MLHAEHIVENHAVILPLYSLGHRDTKPTSLSLEIVRDPMLHNVYGIP